MRNTFSALCLLTGLLPALAFAAAAGTPVGRVQIASGDVQIVAADKRSRPLARGDVVNEGDTIVTGKTGAAHIRMIDEGIIAVRPDTTLLIDTYRYEGREDGSERGVLSLIKGGFRTITGVIGRTNKSQYIVNTRGATIGIRGTDHEPYFIPPPQPGETPVGEPGTYNKVNVGETFIRSDTGTVEVGPNQVGFASLQPNVAPVRLERLPQFMRSSTLPRGKPDMRNVRDFTPRDPRRAELVQQLRERNVSPRDLRRLLAFRIRTAGEDFDLGGQSTETFRFAPPGVALSGSFIYVEDGNLRGTTGGLFVTDRSGDSILLNAGNEPVILSDRSGFRYSREGASMVDRGGAFVDGAGVLWGVYTGGLQFTEAAGVSRVLLLTFMETNSFTPAATLALPGAAAYTTTVGFTSPVDENRRIGGVADLNAGVMFGASPRLVAYNLRVRDASARNWTASLAAPQSLQSFSRPPSGTNLNVTCSGACPAAGSGKASGFVIGDNRGGLMSSYGLIAGPNFVTGSILVRQ
ncbi:MAG TPA: FecR domain-containing protein [Burkholderiales bacterium]|nr:FecR domain-containing protein [Burkholderiales bacterium]